jgi:RNA polymerase sigma-70 factor (ECF subfamily)
MRSVMDARPDLDEASLLAAARAGDRAAFDRLLATRRDALLAHCYRMLGSIHDADDAHQDALLRAWRGLSGFDERSTLDTWLYRIATNASLDVIGRRARRSLPVEHVADGVAGPGLPHEPAQWIEPFAHPVDAAGPEASIVRRESVELAFTVALQHLPPNQRAVLLLRDVLGFSAKDSAGILDASVAAVTSSLQRARRTLAERRPRISQQRTIGRLADPDLAELVGRYVAAWERADAGAIVELLTDDATFSMPPHPSWYRGAADIGRFLEAEPLQLPWRLVPCIVGGQVAFACYSLDGGRWVAHSVDVVTLRGDRIEHVVGFLDPTLVTRAGLPAELAERPRGTTGHADAVAARIAADVAAGVELVVRSSAR